MIADANKAGDPYWLVCLHNTLAEDNATNQRLAKALLGKIGCRVDVAANGREGCEKAAPLSYDLIFMDCQMPEMDDYPATRERGRRLRGRPAHASRGADCMRHYRAIGNGALNPAWTTI